MAIRDIARTIKLSLGYTLAIGDERDDPKRCGTLASYEMRRPDGIVLFEGTEYGIAPSNAIDSDESFAELLAFLTLKPGDTDEEYFDNYTAEQMAWCESFDCETLGLDAYEVENCGGVFFDVTDGPSPSIDQLAISAEAAYDEYWDVHGADGEEDDANQCAAYAVAETCEHSTGDARIAALAKLADAAYAAVPGEPIPVGPRWRAFAAVCAGINDIATAPTLPPPSLPPSTLPGPCTLRLA